MSTEPQFNVYVDDQLFWFRWVVLAALLLLTLAQPTVGRGGIPAWALILLFAGYNLLIELLHNFMPFLSSTWVPILDLPVAGLVYYLGPFLDGPTFVPFLLVVGCAALCMSTRAALLYTGVAAILLVVLASLSPQWSADTRDIFDLGSQLIVLALIGIGTVIVRQRMRRTRATGEPPQDGEAPLELFDRLRKQSIAAISHDLRTPLTAIKAGIGMAATSANDRLHAGEQDMLQAALRNVERLRMLIDDLLTFNQIETGAMQLERELIDLRAVVNAASKTIGPLLEEKNQRLEIYLPETLSVCGDFKYLEHVMANILANTHYHTPPGTRILISSQRTNGKILLMVRDDGPGIPEEDLEAIFLHTHRFSWADGSSGLGLAVARDIITLHEGRIGAESHPGVGTTFHVALTEAVQGGGR